MVLRPRNNVDPRKLGEQMAVIQAGYNCKVDKTQKIAVVVRAAGRIYADMIQQETVCCEVQLVPENYRLNGGGDLGGNYKKWQKRQQQQ